MRARDHIHGSGRCNPAAAEHDIAVVKDRRLSGCGNDGFGEAQARGVSGTIAVADRVGNVLAVFRMNGAATSVTVVSPGTAVSGGLEGVNIVPDSLAAIAKAVTAAYLSTEGNAFTTRTASQIVQAHFNPNDNRQPGGPLFGVQFSQLPCSDLSNRFSGIAPTAGPQRSPLGLSADPGGLPLYKGGTPVGGIGVISDGTYTFDPDVTDTDIDDDELVFDLEDPPFHDGVLAKGVEIVGNELQERFL